MLLECPHCKAKLQFDEKHLAGRAQVNVACPKCKQTFPLAAEAAVPKVEAPKPAAPKADTAPRPAPPMPERTVLAKDASTLHLPTDKRIALSVIRGEHKGTDFECGKPRVVIGRSGADWVLEDEEISRQHCAIEIAGDSITLLDLNSTNGTFIEGRRIQRESLQHLAEFQVGSHTILVTVTPRG